MEYKWLLVFDTIHSQLPVPSENAKPLPAHLAQKSRTTAEDPSNDDPKADEPFGDPHSKFIWSEFNTCKPFKNSDQVKIDLSKPKQLWFYLGRTSTEAKAQYTGDPAVSHNNLEANFLESVRAASAAVAVSAQRRSFPASYPSGVNIHAVNAARAKAHVQQAAKIQVKPPVTKERPYNGKYAILDSTPYVYKPKISCNVDPQALRNQRAFQQSTVHSLPQIKSSSAYRAPPAPMSTMAPMAPMMARAPQADLKQENNASVEFRLVSLHYLVPEYNAETAIAFSYYTAFTPLFSFKATASRNSTTTITTGETATIPTPFTPAETGGEAIATTTTSGPCG